MRVTHPARQTAPSLNRMHTRVTAILVARTGVAYLDRTLEGLAGQSRRPDTIVAVDAGSTDRSADLLAASGPAQLVSIPGSVDFGTAIARALTVAVPVTSPQANATTSPGAQRQPDNEWLWLLAHDNAPHPDALRALLAAVEIAPSVGIAGPKMMRWEDPDVIAEFGETITALGASFALVAGELDQAQHDVQSDVLAVASGGMLVRRSLWAALGGFDPALPNVDAALDFSIRARLAGFRVVGVPGAKVASAGGAELFGRRSISDRRRARLRRSAQLHRRLVYARAALLPLHWLSLLPIAILRSIYQLLAKRPGAVGGELAAALIAAFAGSRVGAARRNLKRTRTKRWSSIAPLRVSVRQVRERRSSDREIERDEGTIISSEPRASFVSNGGLLAVVFAAVVSLVAWGPTLAWPSIAGGTLLPLSNSPAELWANVGFGSRNIADGFTGAADPFAYVLAVLGSVTFWSPSFSIVLLYVLAMPISALGAWFAARRLTTRHGAPALAAVLWALAPPLLGSLAGGHLGAILAHLVLPWFVLTVIKASRSWTASATAALLLAVIGASAPLLIPALVLFLVVSIALRPKRIFRLGGIVIPIAALWAPLVIQQSFRGNLFGLLAEPGVPTVTQASSPLHLALLSPIPGLNGWDQLLRQLSLAETSAPIVVAALLLPVAGLAILALFVPGSRRAIPALALSLLGFATAVAASHIQVANIGSDAATVWSGAALSVFWLGLIAAALVALDALGRASISLGVLAGLTTAALAAPLLASLYLPNPAIGTGQRGLPAVVIAETRNFAQIGTLVLSAEPAAPAQDAPSRPSAGAGEGSLAATLERGVGATLDDQSTLAATSARLSDTERSVANLAGNLASRSGLDATSEFDRLAIGFVLLLPDKTADAAAQAIFARTTQALDSNALLSPVGDTGNGILWRYQALSDRNAPPVLSNTATPFGPPILLAQGIIFGATLLLGIPTSRRRRRVIAAGNKPGQPAATFDRDENDD